MRVICKVIGRIGNIVFEFYHLFLIKHASMEWVNIAMLMVQLVFNLCQIKLHCQAALDFSKYLFISIAITPWYITHFSSHMSLFFIIFCYYILHHLNTDWISSLHYNLHSIIINGTITDQNTLTPAPMPSECLSMATDFYIVGWIQNSIH